MGGTDTRQYPPLCDWYRMGHLPVYQSTSNARDARTFEAIESGRKQKRANHFCLKLPATFERGGQLRSPSCVSSHLNVVASRLEKCCAVTRPSRSTCLTL